MVMSVMVPIIYNLFPTLVGPVDGWIMHALRARAMGFNWFYVNPFCYPGFSVSLYAIKDYDRLHPALEPRGARSPMDALADAFRAIRAMEIGVMSDLAEVDNADSPDREALWRFWEDLVDRALDLGVTGFRCDAAYKVPAALWRRLLAGARARQPGALWVAETLGCTLEEMAALGRVGFDYFYNSSKWWDLVAPWCLDQHERFRAVAPSIAFPESHDTPRLAAETGGSEAIQRQRYALAALFSAGVQMTVGYEFGFQRPLDVVKTRPTDWEEPRFDLAPFLRLVTGRRAARPLLRGSCAMRRLEWGVSDVSVVRNWSVQGGTHRCVVVVNSALSTARHIWP